MIFAIVHPVMLMHQICSELLFAYPQTKLLLQNCNGKIIERNALDVQCVVSRSAENTEHGYMGNVR